MNNKKWGKHSKQCEKPTSKVSVGYVPFSQREKPEPALTFDEMFPAGLVAPIIKTNVWSGNFKAAIEKAPVVVVVPNENKEPHTENPVIVKEFHISEDVCDCQYDDCPCPCHYTYSNSPGVQNNRILKRSFHDEDSNSIVSSNGQNEIVESDEQSECGSLYDEVEEGEKDGAISD
jgi:hypothetical protein